MTNDSIARGIGRLLRTGVLSAGALMLAGALLFLAAHGSDPADYGTFRGEPAALRTAGGILRSAVTFEPRALMQLGIALLIATPIARVAFSVGAFARARNTRYVAITAGVLAVLAYSIFGSHN